MITISHRLTRAKFLLMAINEKLAKAKNTVVEDRICELFNMVHFAGWAITLSIDPRILTLFQGFTSPSWVYASAFLALTISSIIGMFPSRFCRSVAALSMSAGAAVWFAMGIIFWQSYPPFSPWMLYYPFVAFFTYIFAQVIEKECKTWGHDV